MDRNRLLRSATIAFVSILGVCMLMGQTGVNAAFAQTTVSLGNVALSGGYQAGNFPSIWDLTAGPLTITFTYDANGLSDAAGAHAWGELGVRGIGKGNFNPNNQGVWLATDYDGAVGTFGPDPAGAPKLDLDDKVILQKASGQGEGSYDLPSSPNFSNNNYAFWFDRDGVDQWQAVDPGAFDGKTFNTGGQYNIVITLTSTGSNSGTAFMTVNGLPQGFCNSASYVYPPALSPAGITFAGDMKHLQVFYGLYGYGATHSIEFTNITVTGYCDASNEKQLALNDLSQYSDADKRIGDAIDKAIERINQSLAPELWDGPYHLSAKGKKVFDKEKEAVNELTERIFKKYADQYPGVLDAIRHLFAADETLAGIALQEAVAQCNGDAQCVHEVTAAEGEMDKAEADFAAGNYDNAIDHCKKACEHAMRAEKKAAEPPLPKEGFAQAELPKAAALEQNYPNPFNPVTTIRFALSKDAPTRLVVYDMLGREVARLVDGMMTAGYHGVVFNASQLSTGIYLYKLETGNFTQVRRLSLVK